MTPTKVHLLFRAACIGAVAVLMVSGCSSTVSGTAQPTSGGSSASATPTSATPTFADPRDVHRAKITYDPCADVPDVLIAQQGYRTSTKKSNVRKGDSYYWLDCQWLGEPYRFSISSGISDFNQAVQHYQPPAGVPTTINGRTALLLDDPAEKTLCGLFLLTSYGMVLINRDRMNLSEPPVAPRCQGMEDLARIIEPTIIDTYKK